MSNQNIAGMLVALTLLLIMANTIGHLFVRLRQPAVIGEILGGLLLGPTVLGLVAPDVHAYLFPKGGVVATVLSATTQLGLTFLMFLAGAEVRPRLVGREQRTVAMVAATGLVIPFAVGVGAVRLLDTHSLMGPKGSIVTVTLVFGIAVAVTSVPVISRIMLDLGIMRTRLARLVLSVAIIEDILLYVLLAVVLGLAESGDSQFGLVSLLPTDSLPIFGTYYILVSLLFFLVGLTMGPRLFRWLAGHPANVLERRSPTAFRLMFLLVAALSCVLLGINPIFGALLSGSSASRGDALAAVRDRDPAAADGPVDATAGQPSVEASAGTTVDLPPDRAQAWITIRQFCMAFFVPLYFAGVGLNLDLIHNFDVAFFVGFLVLACVAKFGSVLLGARLAGEPLVEALHLSVALNARGGPGIVLATVTFAAGVINESFFTALVVLSIITSQLAGTWLDLTLRRPAPDRADTEPAAR